jgi:hypothetical protein
MASEQTFEQKLQSHMGGLVRVCYGAWADHARLIGKIGLLMSVATTRTGRSAQAELLIDGSVKKLILYPDEIELIGADDAK